MKKRYTKAMRKWVKEAKRDIAISVSDLFTDKPATKKPVGLLSKILPKPKDLLHD
jgi:hypothetical protein